MFKDLKHKNIRVSRSCETTYTNVGAAQLFGIDKKGRRGHKHEAVKPASENNGIKSMTNNISKRHLIQYTSPLNNSILQ